MVEFHDPVTNTELKYYIAKELVKKWDKYKDGKLVKEDADLVIIVDGKERMGKSLFTFQQAKYLDPSFDLNRVCFNPKEFLHQIRTAPQGSVVVFDEAFRGLSSKGSQSKINKEIVQALMEVGQRNLIIFIVLPTFFLLEIYAAVLRSHALLHIYKIKGLNKGRGFRIYNEKHKGMLWKNGKKKGFDYSFPKVKVRGRFFNKYPIDEQEYRKKKLDSLRGYMDEDVVEEAKVPTQRKMLITSTHVYLKLMYNYTQIQTCQYLTSIGIEMDRTTLSAIITNMKKLGLYEAIEKNIKLMVKGMVIPVNV